MAGRRPFEDPLKVKNRGREGTQKPAFCPGRLSSASANGLSDPHFWGGFLDKLKSYCREKR
jgi:hypothetical protein